MFSRHLATVPCSLLSGMTAGLVTGSYHGGQASLVLPCTYYEILPWSAMLFDIRVFDCNPVVLSSTNIPFPFFKPPSLHATFLVNVTCLRL